LHSELQIPASPGSLTLYYPKWLPADHSPDGPISNIAGLKFSSNGKELPWQQDDVDMYTFHLDVPKGADSIDVHLDFLLSTPGAAIDFSASGSSKLLILMWHEVLLYPAGLRVNQITFHPTLQLPPEWKFNTSLPVSSQSGRNITRAATTAFPSVRSPTPASAFSRRDSSRTNSRTPGTVNSAARWGWQLPIFSSR